MWCLPQLVQSRTDESGGEWLLLRAEEDVHEWFGDPNPGSSKVLRLQFEVKSKTGDVVVEVRVGSGWLDLTWFACVRVRG